MAPILTTTHPRAQCIDLRATFRGRFRFAYDEAYAVERSDFRRLEAVWLTLIPCRAGRIFPWGGRKLAAYCGAGAAKRRALQAVPGVTIAQGGQGCPETVVTLDVDRLEAVAAVLGARRPRRLSPEHRARLLAASVGHRFRAGRTRHGSSVASAALDLTIGTSVGLAHVDDARAR